RVGPSPLVPLGVRVLSPLHFRGRPPPAAARVSGMSWIRVPAHIRLTTVRTLAGLAGTDHAAPIECAGAPGGRDRRMAMVGTGPQLRVPLRLLDVLPLQHGRLEMRLALGEPLPRRWRRPDSAGTAVVADSRHIDIVDDRLVVGVMDDIHVDVRDTASVGKHSACPASAEVTDAGIPEAVVHPAVESDVRAPIPGVPDVCAADAAPVSRRPKTTDPRRRHPGA